MTTNSYNQKQKAVIYARFSSDKQSDASIEDQIAACKEYAYKHDWDVMHIYSDRAISGSDRTRPEYQAMRASLEKQEFDIVLAFHLDRLYRDTEESANFYKLANFHHVEIWTVSDNHCDELKHDFHGIMNAQFLRSLSKHTLKGMEGVLNSNRNLGGRAYGYRSESIILEDGSVSRGHLSIHEDEAKTVQRIFDEYNSGKSPQQIAAGLNADGIDPPRGKLTSKQNPNSSKQENGQFWRQSTINGNRQRGTGIINNELYIGKHVWNKSSYSRHPQTNKRISRLNPKEEWKRRDIPELRIIDQEVWDKAKERQAGIQAHTESQRKTADHKSPDDKNKLSGAGAARRNTSFLSGKLFCGECGRKITASSGGRVVCSTAIEAGSSICTNKTHYKREIVTDRITTAMRTEMMQPEAIELFVKEYNAALAEINASYDHAHKQQMKELNKVNKELDNVVDAVASGLLNQSIKDRLNALEARKIALQAALEQPRAEAVSIHPNASELYAEQIRNLTQSLNDPKASVEAKDAFKGLIEKITLYPRKDRGKGEFDLDIEGVLAALLKLAGIKKGQLKRLLRLAFRKSWLRGPDLN